jgi:hypothetical protein
VIVFELLLLAFVVLAAIWAVSAYNAKHRRSMLLEKYGDEKIVAGIINKTIWQGMTTEQFIDSWGPPTAKEQKLYKTKVTETFKYNQTGRNRFSSRVIVENGIVTGWKQR